MENNARRGALAPVAFGLGPTTMDRASSPVEDRAFAAFTPVDPIGAHPGGLLLCGLQQWPVLLTIRSASPA